MAHSRQVFPSITLSAETKACLEDFKKPPAISPFDKLQPSTDFVVGKPKTVIQIDKKVAMAALHKSLCGLLRIKGYECMYSASIFPIFNNI